MMRVNSPGSETPTGSGPLAGSGEEAADDCRSSVNLWINMVMLPGAFEDGTPGCGALFPETIGWGFVLGRERSKQLGNTS